MAKRDEIRKLDRDYQRRLRQLYSEWRSKRHELLGNEADDIGEDIPLPLLPPFYDDIYWHEMYDELRRLRDEIRELRGDEFQESAARLLISNKQTFAMMQDVVSRLKDVSNSVLRTPLVGKLDLRKFAFASMRKIWDLKYIWSAITAVVFLLAIVLPTQNGEQQGHYGAKLYTAWMAFTTVGYGDWHPATWYAQIVAVLLGLLGIITIALFVTIVWTAALESTKEA